MRRRLSHLNALLALEASARLGSFTRAAQELGVTPAAVGQQIRTVERFIGRKLFRRTPTGLEPTSVTEAALAELRDGFDKLALGFTRLSGPANTNRLSVTAAPALAGKWLAPRMQGLYRRSPQIDLRIDTSLRLADIEGGEFDLAIRYCDGVPKTLKGHGLFQEHILPVCAPSLQRSITQNIQNIRDMPALDMPLLHIDGETSDPSVPSWPIWGRAYGLHEDSLRCGAKYPHSIMAIEAAINGQGIALCGIHLVIDDLLAGRLVAPFGSDSAVRTRSSYSVIYSSVRQQSEVCMTFVQWIRSEANLTRKLVAQFMTAQGTLVPAVATRSYNET